MCENRERTIRKDGRRGTKGERNGEAAIRHSTDQEREEEERKREKKHQNDLVKFFKIKN